MPGHMGMEKTTVQNLKVVELNLKDGYMLIRGSVPGAKNGFIRVSKAIKKAQ
jgi:large subunit ribosomal protein L3